MSLKQAQLKAATGCRQTVALTWIIPLIWSVGITGESFQQQQVWLCVNWRVRRSSPHFRLDRPASVGHFQHIATHIWPDEHRWRDKPVWRLQVTETERASVQRFHQQVTRMHLHLRHRWPRIPLTLWNLNDGKLFSLKSLLGNRFHILNVPLCVSNE